MKNVIGGLIAIILGVFFFTIFFPSFLNFLAGIIPFSLILGGGLIIYLKSGKRTTDDWDTNKISNAVSPTPPTQTAPTETEPVEKATENPTDDIPPLQVCILGIV